MYCCSSLDKSNLGNAKTLGMIKDIGGDPSGDRYALLNAFYFISYAPFSQYWPFSGCTDLCLPEYSGSPRPPRQANQNGHGAVYLCNLLGHCRYELRRGDQFPGLVRVPILCRSGRYAISLVERQRKLSRIAEAGFSPLIQVYLSRFYTRRALGSRVAFWLAMAPMGYESAHLTVPSCCMLTPGRGFINGIVAYGVAFIHSNKLASWRILFLIEGLATILLGVVALIILPEDIARCRWLKDDEKDYREFFGTSQCHLRLNHAVQYQRSLSMAPESHEINWHHARGVLYRWQQLLRTFISCALRECVLTPRSGLHEPLPADHGRSSFRFPPHSDQRERLRGRHRPDCNARAIRLGSGRKFKILRREGASC